MAQTTVIVPSKVLLKTEDDAPHNVCAYCRVSTDETDQRNSLAAQRDFFARYFAAHNNWHNMGILADEGLSGTSLEKRDQFGYMLAMARGGLVDIILTKEVSRFSRNVQHLLNIVEELRSLGVYIWFLADDINTETFDYREKITQIATNAEQESLRTSRRVRWGHQQKMQLGVVFGRRDMFGYTIVKDAVGVQHFEIIAEEADIVKQIFTWFAAGDGTHSIARRLERMRVPSKRYAGGWSNTVILRILRNERYVGDLAQGKTYTPDPLTHKKKYNRGESYRVYIRDHHPEAAIIERGLWDRVQEILRERAPSEAQSAKHTNRYWASGKIYCGLCGGRCVSIQKKQREQLYKAWLCMETHQRGQKKEILLDNGNSTSVGCNARRVNDRVLKSIVRDIIEHLMYPYKAQIAREIQQEILSLAPTSVLAKWGTEIEKKIIETKQTLVELALQLSRKKVSEEVYTIAKERTEDALSQLQKSYENIQHQKNIPVPVSARIEAVLSFSEEQVNEELYARLIKKIIVYPNCVLEMQFSFMQKPLFVRYRTTGKGKGYTTEMELFVKDQQL